MSGLSICVIANDLVNFMNNDTVENFSKLIDKIARQMERNINIKIRRLKQTCSSELPDAKYSPFLENVTHVAGPY